MIDLQISEAFLVIGNQRRQTLALASVLIGVINALATTGTAPSFIVVATLFLAATMLGWRLVARFVA